MEKKKLHTNICVFFLFLEKGLKKTEKSDLDHNALISILKILKTLS